MQGRLGGEDQIEGQRCPVSSAFPVETLKVWFEGSSFHRAWESCEKPGLAFIPQDVPQLSPQVSHVPRDLCVGD